MRGPSDAPTYSEDPAHRAFLVDAHVHYYSCFSASRFLDAALLNFREGAAASEPAVVGPGWLILTEGAREDWFRALQRQGRVDGDGRWHVQQTEEDASLILHREGGGTLILLAGRQLTTNDGLEVLALACVTPLCDGNSLEETIAQVHAATGIAVIPWGFGKWGLRRGKKVRAALEHHGDRGADLFLGDNGGRCRIGPTPKLFSLAHALGFWVLPGTDPLPFPSEQMRAGSFGFLLECEPDLVRPASAFKQSLRALRSQPRTYGQLESPARFLTHQIRMQFRKRWSQSFGQR